MNQERRTKNQGRRTSVPFRVFRVFRGCPALNRERSRGRGTKNGGQEWPRSSSHLIGPRLQRCCVAMRAGLCWNRLNQARA
jgi:hypothetical protein